MNIKAKIAAVVASVALLGGAGVSVASATTPTGPRYATVTTITNNGNVKTTCDKKIVNYVVVSNVCVVTTHH